MSKGKLLRGELGEELVSNELRKDTTYHKHINNLTIVDKNGMSHQIDHILIRKNGIFIIETKNYFGEIEGQESDLYWTRKIVKGKRVSKERLLNPIKQHKSHLLIIRKIIKDYPTYGFIVFVRNNISHLNIFSVIDLQDLFNRINLLTIDKDISNEEIDNIYLKLMKHSSEVSIKEHVGNIENLKKEKKEFKNEATIAIEKRICPRCETNLILKGNRLFCPKCKFEIKI